MFLDLGFEILTEAYDDSNAYVYFAMAKPFWRLVTYVFALSCVGEFVSFTFVGLENSTYGIFYAVFLF